MVSKDHAMTTALGRMESALSQKIRSLREAVAVKAYPNEVFKPGDEITLDASAHARQPTSYVP